MDAIGRARYRTLQVGFVLMGLLALGGLLAILEVEHARVLDLALFSAVIVLCFGLVPVSRSAAERGDTKALERLAIVCIGVGCLLVLERIAVTLYGPMFDDPRVDLFRLHFACTVLIQLAAFALMRAKAALHFCWISWAAVVAVTLPGLYLHAGFDTARPGYVSLLIWLLVANPLFILMLHALLPKYEETIQRHVADIAELRERTELMEKVRESEGRFNLVVQALEVGVWDRWIGPPEKRWWSPRFYELIGYKPEQLSPTEDHLRDLLHPDDRDAVFRSGNEQLAHGNFMDVDFRLKTAHRGYRWFNARAKADRDVNGRMLRLAGSLTDIHDRRANEEQLQMAQVELTRLSYRDPLTDLHNRRYFEEHFQREWERARRSHQPLALLLIDLDHFKAYNDRYGHPAGDQCLVKIAELLKRCANRATDIVARLGGEEFGIVLPDSTAIGAEEVARRMLADLVAAGMAHGASPVGLVTLSAGVAAIEGPEGPGPGELFEQADKALYEAKRTGRNTVVRFGAKAAGVAA